MYSTLSILREELENLRFSEQLDEELEESYRKRFNQATHHYGNVHEDDEKMTLYIDGLLKTIEVIFAHHRESVTVLT